MNNAPLFEATTGIIKKFGLDALRVDPHDDCGLEDIIYLHRLAEDPDAVGPALVVKAFADGKVQARYETRYRGISSSTHWSSDIATSDQVILQAEREIGGGIEAAGRTMRRQAGHQASRSSRTEG
jgi:hypothetical protein